MNLLKKLSVVVVCGATLVMSCVAYIYAQPGKTMKIKWRRSYRTFKRYSKELLKDSSTNLFPIMQGLIGVMQFAMERLPQ